MKKISLIIFFIFFLSGSFISKTEALDIVPTIPDGNYTFLETVNGVSSNVNYLGNWSYTNYSECNAARINYQNSKQPTPTLTVCSQPSLQKALDNIVYVSPQNAPGSAVSNVYNFLAPIGLGTSINTTDIGVYFNWIFKLAIGLCAALAVIMIIIASVQYMGDESIFGKTEAKDKILKAILGLLIAVGSWVLLNTINPALTGVNGVNVANVTVDVEDIPWSTYESGDNITSCSVGFKDVITNATPAKINVCGSIYDNLNRMIIAAKADNPSIILSGGGSRKISTQQALRVKNSCPNLTTPPSSCHPNVVAIPGTSNHEKGLAVDFNCNGVSMTKGDTSNKCYQWLVKNAGTYNFLNKLAVSKGEVWHWSTTGY